jgi:hypothetical protein
MGVTGDNRDAIINSLIDAADEEITVDSDNTRKKIIEKIQYTLANKKYKKGDEKL